MPAPALIKEILALYGKHGWALRRMLLTENTLQELAGSFDDVEKAAFEKDAAWFSRPSGKNGEAWEIRLLSETPYALIEVFGPDQNDREQEEIRRGMEQRLLDTDPVKIDVKN